MAIKFCFFEWDEVVFFDEDLYARLEIRQVGAGYVDSVELLDEECAVDAGGYWGQVQLGDFGGVGRDLAHLAYDGVEVSGWVFDRFGGEGVYFFG